MKVAYDPKADALYIKLRDGEFKENQEIEEGLILDLDANKSILGIEILDASKKMPRESLAHVDVEIPSILSGTLAT
jgi:uncharacterized protein YuzE